MPQSVNEQPLPTPSTVTDGEKPHDKSEQASENQGLNFRDSVDERVDGGKDWVIEKLIAKREQMLIYGPPKVGKSQFTLQLAVAVALGKPFLQWANTGGQKKTVLYVNFEIDEQSFMRRLSEHVLTEIHDDWKPISSDEPLNDENKDKVNQQISKRFYFSDGIRHMGITEKALEKALENRDDRNPEKSFVEEWQDKISKINPELIIFDTLSKMHLLDESANITIQAVLMLIRKIASIKSKIPSEPNTPVAHIIVHHSRKGSGNRSKFEKYRTMDLDAIRGGSAIRAEADVIIGLGGSEGSSTEGGGKRHLVIEARNFDGGDVNLRFDGIRFKLDTLNEDPVKDLNLEEDIATKVYKVFLSERVRAYAPKQLACVITKKNERATATTEVLKKIRIYVKSNISERKDFIFIKGEKRKQAFMVGPNHESAGHVKEMIWIPDESPWLEREEFKAAISKTPKTQELEEASNGKPIRRKKRFAKKSNASKGATGKTSGIRQGVVKGSKQGTKRKHGAPRSKTDAGSKKSKRSRSGGATNKTSRKVLNQHRSSDPSKLRKKEPTAPKKLGKLMHETGSHGDSTAVTPITAGVNDSKS